MKIEADESAMLILIWTAPPDTFAVYDRGAGNCIGKVRHHTPMEGEQYWTVSGRPDGPSYGTRDDAVRALMSTHQ